MNAVRNIISMTALCFAFLLLLLVPPARAASPEAVFAQALG